MPDSRTVRVVNSAGLHARPCHAIVSTAIGYACSLRIRRSADGATAADVNGKSILELMTLEARQGAELELMTEGDGESELLADLAELFARGFGEPG
ncbi:MAG: HPr family phosphocarrier protein [Planctomycetota bacterium]